MKNKRKYTWLDIGVIVLLFVLVFAADRFLPSYDIKAKVLQKGAVFALIAVSMNLLNGFTGLFSLGQAGFMLLGAYTYAIFTIPVADRVSVYKYYTTTAADGTTLGGLVQFTLPVFVAILLAGAVAALFAFLIGLPVLRLKSDYLAIATLGFAEILRALCQWKGLGVLTNGSNQLRMYPTFKGIMPYFLVSAVCIAIIALLIHSTYGRAFKAIRDDEVAAEAMGINLTKHKMISFVTSSFFAGIGGAQMSCIYTLGWANDMINGRGFIASALVILCSWKPLRAYMAAYLFGLAQALIVYLQVKGVAISMYFTMMLPYLLTLAALAVISTSKKPSMPEKIKVVSTGME